MKCAAIGIKYTFYFNFIFFCASFRESVITFDVRKAITFSFNTLHFSNSSYMKLFKLLKATNNTVM